MEELAAVDELEAEVEALAVVACSEAPPATLETACHEAPPATSEAPPTTLASSLALEAVGRLRVLCSTTIEAACSVASFAFLLSALGSLGNSEAETDEEVHIDDDAQIDEAPPTTVEDDELEVDVACSVATLATTEVACSEAPSALVALATIAVANSSLRTAIGLFWPLAVPDAYRRCNPGS